MTNSYHCLYDGNASTGAGVGERVGHVQVKYCCGYDSCNIWSDACFQGYWYLKMKFDGSVTGERPTLLVLVKEAGAINRGTPHRHV